jgi:hypothetical protein
MYGRGKPRIHPDANAKPAELAIALQAQLRRSCPMRLPDALPDALLK